MTISNQSNRTSATGSGSTGQEIPFLFPITLTSDLTVYKLIVSTGVQTTLVETTNYTVSISGTSGGTVTTVTTIETTEEIHIVRGTPFTQALDLEQGGSFNAENIETAFDKSARLAIRNRDAIVNKAIRFPETDAPGLTTILPSSVDRASKNLTFDSSGNVTASDSVEEGSVSFTTLGTNIAEAAVAVTVRDLIELDVYGVDARSFAGADIGAKINTAMTYLVDNYNSRGKIIVAPGEYEYSTTIVLKAPEDVIYAENVSGSGWNTALSRQTILDCMGAKFTYTGSGRAIQMGTDDTTWKRQIIVKNLQLYNSGSGTHGVYFTQGCRYGSGLRDVGIYDFDDTGAIGIYLTTRCELMSFERIHIRNCDYAFRYQDDGNAMDYNVLSSSVITACNYGYYLNGTGDSTQATQCVIRDCMIEYNNFNIFARRMGRFIFDNVHFANQKGDSNTPNSYAIKTQNSNGQIINCYIQASAGVALDYGIWSVTSTLYLRNDFFAGTFDEKTYNLDSDSNIYIHNGQTSYLSGSTLDGLQTFTKDNNIGYARHAFGNGSVTTDTDAAQDGILACNDAGVSSAIVLSSEDATIKGRVIIITDESGAAGTYPISIGTEGSETIDGTNGISLSKAYGSVALYSNGTNWFTLTPNEKESVSYENESVYYENSLVIL